MGKSVWATVPPPEALWTGEFAKDTEPPKMTIAASGRRTDFDFMLSPFSSSETVTAAPQPSLLLPVGVESRLEYRTSEA
jgi:hypothetical protein